MSGKYELAVSVLAKSPRVYRALLRQAKSLTPHIHIDVMDGLFVKTKSIGQDDIGRGSLGRSATVHLMVQSPLTWVTALKRSGCRRVIIHSEIPHFAMTHRAFRALGWQVGLALKSSTPIRVLTKVPAVTWIHLMDGPVGRYGARRTGHWVEHIRHASQTYPRAKISCDIGMNPQTIPAAVQAGATEIVVGSYVWSSPTPAKRWAALQAQQRQI